jgi:alkylhydroperoxidase family enzyme
MVLDGMGQRAIARELGCSPCVVDADFKAILAEDAARKPLQAEEMRAVISTRLDDSRARLLAIARDEGGHVVDDKGKVRWIGPTASEGIAAERALVDIEEKRAKLLGVAVRTAEGDLAAILLDIATRNSGSDSVHDVDALPVSSGTATAWLPPPTPTTPTAAAPQRQSRSEAPTPPNTDAR